MTLFWKNLFINLISFAVWIFLRLKNHFSVKNISFRVLLYHSISNKIKNKEDKLGINVPPDLFIRQIDFLQKTGYEFIEQTKCLDIIDGEAIPVKKYVLLTFDDALHNILNKTLPFLRKEKIKGTLFISSDYVDKSECFPWLGKRQLLNPMTWGDISCIMDIMELGSHSLTHRNMKLLDEKEIEEEAFSSKQRIEEKTGASVMSFSYPFGFVDSFDDRCKKVLKLNGYKMAFCNVFGENKAGDDPFALKRMRISASDNPFRLAMKMDGAYDWVDRLKAIWVTKQTSGQLKNKDNH